MGERYTSTNDDSSPNKTAHHRRIILKAAEHIVASNKTTICVMDSTLGYKGPVCPVINCYMRNSESGGCTAAESAKASSKLMRDAMTIVEIIEAAREAPDWTTNVRVATLTEKHESFINEAGLDPRKLQYVLDNNPAYANTLNTVFRTQGG